MNENIVTKPKKSKKVTIPLKQYSVFYNIGTDPQFFISMGDEVEKTTTSIKSKTTGQIYEYPIVVVKNDTDGTIDEIPYGTVGNIRTNWSVKP